VALEGYCVVELTDHERWTPGSSNWTAVYGGRTFLFSGPDQQRRFLAAPGHYSPACGGNDPVLAAEGNPNVPGKNDYCVACEGKLYLFSGAATLERFRQNPRRYSETTR
jgi:YHS domain-containing protein